MSFFETAFFLPFSTSCPFSQCNFIHVISTLYDALQYFSFCYTSLFQGVMKILDFLCYSALLFRVAWCPQQMRLILFWGAMPACALTLSSLVSLKTYPLFFLQFLQQSLLCSFWLFHWLYSCNFILFFMLPCFLSSELFFTTTWIPICTLASSEFHVVCFFPLFLWEMAGVKAAFLFFFKILGSSFVSWINN